MGLVNSGCSEDDRYSEPFSSDHPAVITSSFLPKADPPKKEVPEIVEPEGELTLRQALALTLMKNPELQMFSLEIRAAQARQLQAGLWPNPLLDVEVEDIGGSGESKRFDGAETTIQLKQLLELSRKSQKRRKVAAYNSTLAEWDLESKKLDIYTEVTKSFIDLLFIQKKRELSNELINNSQEIVATVEKRVKSGKDSPLELSKAKIMLAKSKIQHNEILKQHRYKKAALASYWGSEDAKYENVVGQFDNLTAAPAMSELRNLLKNNPDIGRWVIEIQKRNAEYRLARAKSIPDITLKGGAKFFNSDDSSALVFGLSIPLTVSDRNQGGRMEAIEQISKATVQKRAVYLAAWKELNRLYANLENARTKATILKTEILQAAGEILRGSKISYKMGKMNYLDLLDSQKTYFAAKNDYIDAVAEYHLTKTELDRIIGK
jgi:cobalt-zinc-cadmium efflux system outer membrane protein